MTGYKVESKQHEIVIDSVAYKVLERRGVTVFYDADGNTLFDVENERLEKEYETMLEKNADLAREDADQEAGEARKDKAGGKSGNDVPADDAASPDVASIKQTAKEKLEKEMEADQDKSFSEPVIGYLLKRCGEDLGLARDVLQGHKTWKKCLDYIYGQARKQATGSRAAVRDEVVYEWAEDYYHKDDKAEEERKAREAAERKKNAKAAPKRSKSAPQEAKKAEAKKEPIQKNNNKGMDGQIDLFSLMGM